jgi:hypothetical protein
MDDEQSNLFPLLLLLSGGISAFALAISIAASFFYGGPKDDELLWFAVASAAAVLGWHELRAGSKFNEETD